MRDLSKRDYSILIANTIDHFDTALYGFLAPIFAANFFPNSDPLISLILAYSVFATTIVTRPVGSYVFGTIALSYGPVIGLSYSLIGVAITTAVLGLLPTYEHIGVGAPLLLIILRSLSGICSSGEMTIAKLFILSDRNNFESNKNSYLYQTSSMVGIVLASFASTIILKLPMEQPYWRLCFVIGGLCALFGYKLRSIEQDMTNSSSFDKKHLSYIHIPIFTSFHTLWKNKIVLFRIAVVSGFSYITYSIPFIVMNNLIPNFTEFSLEHMMTSNTILLVLDMLLLPIVGHFLLKSGAKNTLLCCAILLLIPSLPMLYFTKNASFAYLIAVKLWIIIIGIAFCCKINLWCNDLIKGKEKYLIVGISGSIGSASVGKMAPAICLTLYYYIPSPMVIGVFMMMIAGATIWALWK